MAATLNSEDIQLIAQARFGVPKVHFVRPSGAGNGDGYSPQNAFATVSAACSAASAGEMIYFNGTIAQGSTQVSVPAGVILRGASRNTAIITSTNSTIACVTAAGSAARFKSFTIRGVAPTAAPDHEFQFLLGYTEADPVSSDVVVDDVYLDGDTDGFYFRDSGSTAGYWRIYNSVARTKFDAHVCFGTNTNQQIDYYNSTFIALGPTDSPLTNDIVVGCRAVSAAQGTTRLYDCIVRAETTESTAESNTCIHARKVTGSAGRVEVYRTICATKTPTGYTTTGGPEGTGGLEHHLRCDDPSGGFTPQLIVGDSSYDVKKTRGTITQVETMLASSKRILQSRTQQ